MRAYYFDNIPGDQRLPHDCVPSRPVSLDQLRSIGATYRQVPVEGHEPVIDRIMKEEGYQNRDVVRISKEALGPDYEEKIKNFFHEHMHEDEEIRYILEGSGFFDVRESPTDSWIRIAVSASDLLVVPAGIYHRFTLDEGNRIRTMRIFKDEIKWIPHNRGEETDKNFIRIDYLKSIGVTA